MARDMESFPADSLDGQRELSCSPSSTSLSKEGPIVAPVAKDVIESVRLQAVIAEKERELENIKQLQVSALTNVVAQKNTEIAELQQTFARLKDDFQYNLQIINERDQELADLETQLRDTQHRLSERERELSKAKATISSQQDEREVLVLKAKDAEKGFRSKLKDISQKTAALNRRHEMELARERAFQQTLKREGKEALGKLREQLEQEKQEVTEMFEQHIRRLEMEHERRVDDLKQAKAAVDVKSVRISTELQHLRKQLEASQEEIDLTKKKYSEVERSQSQLQRNHEDELSEKFSVITTLQQRQDATEKERQQLQRDFEEYRERMQLELQHLKQTHQQEVQFARETALVLEEENRSLKAEVHKTKRSIDITKLKLSEQEDTITSLRQKLQDIEIKHRAELQEKNVQISDMRNELEDAVQSISNAEEAFKTKVYEAETELKSVLQEKEALKARVEEFITAQDKLKRSLKNASRDLEESENQREALNVKHRAELETERAKLRDLEDKIELLERQKKESEREIGRLRGEIDELTTSTAEVPQQQAPKMMDSSDRTRTTGITKTMTEASPSAGSKPRKFFAPPLEARPAPPIDVDFFLQPSAPSSSAVPPSPLFSEDMGEPSPIRINLAGLASPVRAPLPQCERRSFAQPLKRSTPENEELRLDLGQADASLNVPFSNQSPATSEAPSYGGGHTTPTPIEEATTLSDGGGGLTGEALRAHRQMMEMKAQNDSLRTVISQMREEMELLGNAAAGTPQRDSTTERGNQELHDLKAQIDVLSKTLMDVSQKVTTGRSRRSRKAVYSDEALSGRSKRGKRKSKSREKGMNDLRAKVREESQKVDRLMDEREKLLDISNQLKADLARLTSGPGTTQSQPGGAMFGDFKEGQLSGLSPITFIPNRRGAEWQQTHPNYGSMHSRDDPDGDGEVFLEYVSGSESIAVESQRFAPSRIRGRHAANTNSKPSERVKSISKTPTGQEETLYRPAQALTLREQMSQMQAQKVKSGDNNFRRANSSSVKWSSTKKSSLSDQRERRSKMSKANGHSSTLKTKQVSKPVPPVAHSKVKIRNYNIKDD